MTETDAKPSMTRAEMVARADELLADAFVSTREVMNSKDAPATSKASAIGSALAIHRLLVGDGAGVGKEPAEMTADEIESEIRRLKAAQVELD